MDVAQDDRLLTREYQYTATTSFLYPSYRSERYNTRLANTTAVYTKRTMAYK